MKLYLALAVGCLCAATSGCGTLCTALDDQCGKLEPFSGTRASSQGHATQLDVPLSLALDVLLLPITVPKAIIGGVAGSTRESPDKKAKKSETSSPAARTEPVAVYLIPLDDFPFDYAWQLASTLSKDLGLNVRTSLPMGRLDLSPFPDGTQYAAEDIVENAYQVGLRFLDRAENSALIALTVRDINDRSRKLRFLFAQHDKDKHTSVISVARMRYGTPTSPAPPDAVFLRIYKMTKRSIGEQYLGLSRSTNIKDVMYSPIMSLDDIDALGIEFASLIK